MVEDRSDETRGDEVTQLLLAWRDGDQQALAQLFPLVEGELHRIAGSYMVRERGSTLQATALVNELFLRLVKSKSVNWRNRAHFLGSAAITMKRVLVDSARKRQAKMRNEGARPLPLDEAHHVATEVDWEVLSVAEALERLKRLDSRQGRAVELFYFGGLQYAELAEILDCSEATVRRALTAGRAWLRREIAATEASLARTAP